MPYDHPSDEMKECMEMCGRCAGVCEETAQHCLSLGGAHAAPEHQGVMRDCATLCGISTCFMARNSRYAGQVCRLCAEVCAQCARECQRLSDGDDHMDRCAETCRQCAESCEEMAGAGV